MKKDNIVMSKSYDFALKTISVYKVLTKEKQEFILSKQLLRSGTAIGALIKEAEHAQSKPDFLNKMNIALKEANETEYWIDLLCDSSYLDKATFAEYLSDISSLIKLLASIVKTTKTSLNR
jgi:four helix bundle protein